MSPHKTLLVALLYGLIVSLPGICAEEVQSPSSSKSGSSNKSKLNPVGLIACPKIEVDSNERVNATLIYYSPRKKQEFVIQLNDEGIENELLRAGFDLGLPTMIYVHAFRQNCWNGWLRDARNRSNFMYEESNREVAFNMLFFDWSTYSMLPYKFAASYVPNLGKLLSKFLEKLAKIHYYDLNNVHLMAFSLGSHVSGNAGRNLPEGLKLGRITSLDPAGPCFFDNTDFGEKNILRASDAKLVVVKHYDKHAFGPWRPLGGVDIFVNGGGMQPGVWVPIASHFQASKHEVQPFTDDCYEVAYECSSRDAFLAGECGDCGEKGEKCFYNDHMDEFRLRKQLGPIPDYKPNTTMFIETGKAPFCRQHYQIVIQMKPETAKSWSGVFARGAFLMKFNRLLEVEPKNYAGNDRFTALLSLDEKIDNVDGLVLKVKSFFSGTKDFLKQLDYIWIKFLSHPLAEEREKRSFKLCSVDIKMEKLSSCNLDNQTYWLPSDTENQFMI